MSDMRRIIDGLRSVMEGDVVPFRKKRPKITSVEFLPPGSKIPANAERISLIDAFGSDAMVRLKDMGFRFTEKPSYWEGLRSVPAWAMEALKDELRLKTYSMEEIFGTSAPRGPMARPSRMPAEETFLVSNGSGRLYLADRTGAETYIRMWARVEG
jgi:hypothetical protein